MTRTASVDVGGTVKRTIGFVALVVTISLLGETLVGVGLPALERVAGAPSSGTVLIVGLLALQVPMVVAALLFIRFVVGREFVTFRWPSERAGIVAGVGALLAATVELGRQLAVLFTSLEAASTVPTQLDVSPHAAGLFLAGILFLAPVVEELLYRGVVQQYVADASSDAVGIAVATVLFVGIHNSALLATAPNAAAAAAGFAPLIAVSVAGGVAYAWTENLTVPVLLHVSYNFLVWIVGLVVTALGLFL